jgi:hypothetical protein
MAKLGSTIVYGDLTTTKTMRGGMAGYSPLATTVTASRSISSADLGLTILCSHASNTITMTVPVIAGLQAGAEVTFIRYGSGPVSFATSGTTIFSTGSKLSIANQYEAATLKYVGSNTWVLVGSLSA